MENITLNMFLKWNGVKDTNTEYLSKLIVEILNNNNDEHLNDLRNTIIKENVEVIRSIEVTQKEIDDSNDHVYAVGFDGEHYRSVYPAPLAELGCSFTDEESAWYQLIYDRVTQKHGSAWAINSPMKAAKALWSVLADKTTDGDECLDDRFLHFKAGTYKYDIHHWFEDYFDLSVAKDLECIV